MSNSFGEIAAAIDKERNEFGLVSASGTQFAEMCSLLQEFLFKTVDVVDFGDSYDCEFPEMRIDYDRLRIVVADDTYADIPFELVKFVFEFCAEISVFNAVRILKTQAKIVVVLMIFALINHRYEQRRTKAQKPLQKSRLRALRTRSR